MRLGGRRQFHQAIFTLAALAFLAHLLDTLVSAARPLTLESNAALASARGRWNGATRRHA